MVQFEVAGSHKGSWSALESVTLLMTLQLSVLMALVLDEADVACAKRCPPWLCFQLCVHALRSVVVLIIPCKVRVYSPLLVPCRVLVLNL